MPQHVALICTTERIDGYQDLGGNDLYAVNISTALTTTGDLILNGAADLLQPWNWQPLAAAPFNITVWSQTLDPNPPTEGKDLPGSGMTVACVAPPTLGHDAMQSLTASLSAQLTGAFAHDPSLLSFDNADPGTQKSVNPRNPRFHPWPHLLTHASTYPAPLPQALNLVLYFRFRIPPPPAASVVKLYVAPQFQASGITCDVSTCNTSDCKPKYPAASAGEIPSGIEWTYPQPDATKPQITVIQPGFDPRTPAMSVWISPSVEDTTNQNWRANLDQTLPDAFDLAQRALDALRSLTPDQITAIFYPPPLEGPAYPDTKPPLAVVTDRTALDAIRIAILSVLRDTADFGLRYAPDGANLVQFVLRSLRNPDNSPAATDAQINAIVSALAAVEKKLTSTTSVLDTNGQPGPSTWLGTLSALFPNLLVLKTMLNASAIASAWTDDSANLTNLVAQLDALQTKLADNGNLAQLLFLSWDNAFTQLAHSTSLAQLLSLDGNTALDDVKTWNALRKQVQDRLTDLASSHTLRKRMLQANIGGPYDTKNTSANVAIWRQITNIPPALDGKIPPAVDGKIAPAVDRKTDGEQLIQNLKDLLSAFFASRFQQQPPPAITIDNSTRVPAIEGNPDFSNWQKLLAAMNTAIAAQSISYSDTLFPSAAVPTTVPHPLIVKVHETGQVDDASDPLRQMCGVGILLTELDEKGNARDWSALNVASLYVNGNQTAAPETTATYIKAASNVFAPFRISLRNGILQTAISYDNHPLIARTPLSPMSSEVVVDAPQGTRANPLFQFRYEAATPWNRTDPNAWAHIYGLKFGRKYHFLVFRMTNSGALPPELTGGGDQPWKVNAPSDFVLPAPNPPVTDPVPYLRRVPISHPRLTFLPADPAQPAPTLTDAITGKLPTFPATVFPLARSGPYGNDANDRPLPLLLLWKTPALTSNPSATYSFTVRPPQINLQTWDRWVADYTDPASPPALSWRNTRAALYADSVTAAKKSVQESVPLNQQASQTYPLPLDTSIDDPAVTALRFTLTPVSTSAVTIANFAHLDQTITIDGPKPIASPFTYHDGFAEVQFKPYKVIVEIGESVDMAVVHGEIRTVTVTVLEGDIWKLTIAPVLTPNDSAKFEQFQPAPYSAQTAARQLLIEAAIPLHRVNTAMPLPRADTPDALWNSVKLEVLRYVRQLTVTLDPTRPASLTRPDLFYKADISHQVWRWMGRPFPDDTFLPQLRGDADLDLNTGRLFTNALNWEAQAFAERSITDVHTTSSNINYQLLTTSTVDLTGSVTSTRQSPDARPLTKYDLAHDSRAHYYFVCLTLHSRYEDLPGFYLTQTLTSSYSFDPKVPAVRTPWNRVFLPAAASAIPPPKPKVLLCIPLTEPLDPSTDTRTGFLVILDEPWFQIGGLSERLNANLQFAPDPTLPPGQLGATDKIPIPEFGPDPTLFTSGFPWVQTEAMKDSLSIAPGAPIGTTFDDLSAAPLFANTCFHFKLPDSNVSPFVVDWYMAKLTFTRSLRANLTTPAPGIALESAPSDPVWLQFLPSSYHFQFKYAVGAAMPIPLNVTELSFQAYGAGIQFLRNETNITLLPGPVCVTPPPQLELWAMLMQQITDAAGKPGQTFQGLFRSHGNGTFQPLQSGIGSLAGYKPGPGDAVYLLEVQKDSRDADIDNDVPAALFSPQTSPTNPNSEITHRIVRLSPRIAYG